MHCTGYRNGTYINVRVGVEEVVVRRAVDLLDVDVHASVVSPVVGPSRGCHGEKW